MIFIFLKSDNPGWEFGAPIAMIEPVIKDYEGGESYEDIIYDYFEELDIEGKVKDEKESYFYGTKKQIITALNSDKIRKKGKEDETTMIIVKVKVEPPKNKEGITEWKEIYKIELPIK